jgi:hypothetical protein
VKFNAVDRYGGLLGVRELAAADAGDSHGCDILAIAESEHPRVLCSASATTSPSVGAHRGDPRNTFILLAQLIVKSGGRLVQRPFRVAVRDHANSAVVV